MAEQVKTKKNDFVELEFIGRNLTNNEIFDTNKLEEAKKLNSNIKEVKPLILCVGQEMVVKGLDEFLEDKEIDKEYTLRLGFEKAFGKRNPQLIRLIPLKMFLAQKVYPEKGMTLALDNSLVKVISVSGGRVLVDFNNPLAGKEIEYEFRIKRIIKDIKEKVNSIQQAFFSQIFEFDVDEEKKKLIFKDIRLTPILNAFRERFKEILGYEVEIIEKKKETKKETELKEETKTSSKEFQKLV